MQRAQPSAGHIVSAPYILKMTTINVAIILPRTLSGEDVDDPLKAHAFPGPFRGCRGLLLTPYMRRHVRFFEIYTDHPPQYSTPYPIVLHQQAICAVQILFKCNIFETIFKMLPKCLPKLLTIPREPKI